MDKAYSRINWQNQPSTSTALGATNLNKMDIALNEVDNRVVSMDIEKADASTVNEMVKNVTFEASTGKITITYQNGTTSVIDTAMEKIVTNFTYNSATQCIDLVLADGTTQSINISDFVTNVDFSASNTIQFSTDANGKTKAEVINGSITDDKIQPNYLADLTVQAQIATTQADKSKRYAVGGVEEGDATDNAQYYSQMAEYWSSQANQSDYRSLTSKPIENPTILPEPSADTLGKIYCDGNSLKITIETTSNDVTSYSWIPFITKDKVANSYNVTEEGFVADARTVKILKDSVDMANNNFHIKQLDNKKIVFLGDSICFGYGWTKTDQATIGWTPTGWGKVIQENNPTCQVKNTGSPSATLTNKLADNNILMQVDSLISNKSIYTPDYIILQGGINDRNSSAEIGKLSDSYSLDSSTETLATVTGAVDYMLYKLKSEFPNARIGFVSSTRCNGSDYQPYLNAIIKACNKWSVSVIDLWNDCELNPSATFINSTYFYQSDGTHPLENAYRKFITPKIAQWLKNDMCTTANIIENYELIGIGNKDNSYTITKNLSSYKLISMVVSIPEYFYNNVTINIPTEMIFSYGRYENVSLGDLICQLALSLTSISIDLLKFGNTSYITPTNTTEIKVYGLR